jgi:crotonobetaine/carnitine-CoA ligase
MRTRIVAELLRRRAAAAPDDPFVKCGAAWLSNAELHSRAGRVASGLRSLGLGKGDRVAFLLPNRQEMVELFFACARSGVVQVPLNVHLKGEFLRYQLSDSGARAAVVDAAGLRSLAAVVDATSVETIVVVDAAPAGAATVPYERLTATPDDGETVELDPRDLLSILYTSGTTGPSKGCMLSNGYYTASPPVFHEHGWIAEDDRVFTSLQLFHGGAHAVLMQALTVPGGSVCFEPTFSASSFIARAREESATLLWTLPPMAMALLSQPELNQPELNQPGPESPDADDGPKFRLAIVPGLGVSAQEEFQRRFGAPVGAEIYGQTECLGVAFSSLNGPPRPGTLGRPAPHLEVRLVDDADEPVDVGEVGELVVRPRIAHAMYSGYWRRPEATVAAWSNLWHHTGDLARADEDGYLTFVDREKDSLRRRGENVSSFELETAIAAHPKVGRAAVCAVPSPLGEDDIKACIVAVPGEPPTPGELFEFFRDHLPYFAVPRFVELRESLPVTAATDRVQKHVLRAEGVTATTWDLDAMGLTVPRSARR